MEKLKLKIQEVSTKCRNYFKEMKKKANLTYEKTKAWIARKKMDLKLAIKKTKIRIMNKVVRYEYKHGYAPRCSMCSENFLCETYQCMPPRRHFWQVKRCPELHSDK